MTAAAVVVLGHPRQVMEEEEEEEGWQTCDGSHSEQMPSTGFVSSCVAAARTPTNGTIYSIWISSLVLRYILFLCLVDECYKYCSLVGLICLHY